MAGPLSESAPRPVSVVIVEGSPASLGPEENHHQQQHHHHHQQTTLPSREQENNVSSNHLQNARSFASTEAQTEPAPHLIDSGDLRDARRRERRLRRHRRAVQRSTGPLLPPPPPHQQAPPSIVTQYGPPGPPPPPPPGPGLGVPAGMGLGPPIAGYLHPPPPHLGLRGLSLGLPFTVPGSVSAFGRDNIPKQCCGLGSPPVRWSILGVGVVGLVCTGAGALLGALRATGRDHIAVALLMIGIGVILVTVSAVAWRITSRENCASFFGLSGISSRIPPARPMHPYAAMIYPEFQLRTPPPSYQASMQEYRLRLLLLDRLQPTSSPPPTYRSNAGSINTNPIMSRESRPPSYCGRGHGTPQNFTIQQAPSKKDANLVRIVQTESEPVILSGDQTPPVTAVEVLAHL